MLKGPPNHATWSGLARAMAFARLQAYCASLVVPGIGPAVAVSFVIWWILNTVAAIRQAMNYGSDCREFLVLLLALPLYVVIISMALAFPPQPLSLIRPTLISHYLDTKHTYT